MASTAQPKSGNISVEAVNKIPNMANNDHIIFKAKIGLNTTASEFLETRETPPIPNSAAATRRVAIGSITFQPNNESVCCGNKKSGIATKTSTRKWIKNHVRRN